MSKDTVETKIRDMPAEVYELMKQRAKRNFRSLNMQIIADLQEAAHQEYAQQQADSETSRG